MCGICGIIRFDNQTVVESQIRQMMLKQKHRGPDDEGIFINKNIGFGFVRLSIIDLSPSGHQPMEDETQRFVIVFNGEIYDYIELREELINQGVTFISNSDTEVLLKMYLKYGAECLDKLNGMFAFAIYDKYTNEIFAARDRFGVKPFYYFTDNDAFYFASEIPPILSVYNKQNIANEEAIFDYLAYNRTDQTEDTFFKGIKKLQHGHFLTIKNQRITFTRWYDIKQRVREEKYDALTYKKLFIDAVKLRLRSDVPVGVCLSGGLDSSSITSVISEELSKDEVHTFSAVYNKGDIGDETEFINVYKNKLRNMHFTSPVGADLLKDLNTFVNIHAEPIPSTGPYAQYRVMKLAGDFVTVTLDGQGADEVLGGYHYFYGFYFKDLLKSLKLIRLISEISHYVRLHKSLYGLKTFAFFMLPSFLKTKARINERNYIKDEFIELVNKNYLSVISDDLYGSKDLKTALINHIEFKLEHLLKWNDKNSMSCSIESRTPFLDYRLVEYALSIPPNNYIKKGYTKHVLRDAMKGILSEKIRLRKDKIGFATPEDEWFRTEEYKVFIYDLLNSQSFNHRNIIDSHRAKELYEKHLNREINISKDIWKWIHLEIWFRTFIDN